MYTLEFNFHTVTSEQAIDALVYAHSVTLWLKHSIDSYQSDYRSLTFERSRDCMLAQLVLANPRDLRAVWSGVK
jgi:hypothetical protein